MILNDLCLANLYMISTLAMVVYNMINRRHLFMRMPEKEEWGRKEQRENQFMIQ